MGKKVVKTLAAGAGAVAAFAAVQAVKKGVKNQEIKEAQKQMENYDPGDRKAYFIGGGLASMAGASYLIRDANWKGENIFIYEATKELGGSNEAFGSPEKGFACLGGRMLHEKTYENFWELFSTIPSIEDPDKSVTDKILDFAHGHPTSTKSRLINKEGEIVDVGSMGFEKEERMELFRLMLAPEEELDDKTIQDWFENMPHFFETNFWYMWQTTFAFQKWSSLFEFKRYMERMLFEFSQIETLEGITRTPYNQYDSIIVPLKQFLTTNSVNFVTKCEVTDVDFKDDGTITATAIHINNKGVLDEVSLSEQDLCFMTNGSMTDCTTLGDYNTPAKMETSNPISANLWYKIAEKKQGLGNPNPFFAKPEETNWESFTVTCKGYKLHKLIEEFSGNLAGSGALMTFKDSNWLLSIVVAPQPYFKNQPIDEPIFWGYGLSTSSVGNQVQKAMRDCTGEEILEELLYHLQLHELQDEIKADIINVIPCMMPYVDAQLQPRKMTDRPSVVPANSVNFAMIGQFVEIPKDMVFTEEYSVRSARIAVYELLSLPTVKICPVSSYKKNPVVLAKALKAAYR